MSKRILVIGIDALDYQMVHRFKSDLPNIHRLMSRGVSSNLESVWPPDSETAWASIYTGWNPAKHGIFRFVDQLSKSSAYLTSERDNNILRGNTFWDIAGQTGRRVCVLFPHIGYPVWEVNGIMVARASTSDDVDVYPEDIARLLDKEKLAGPYGLPGNRLEVYLEQLESLVHAQLEVNLKLISREPWDLIFTYWSALDLVQHTFWNYCDPSDPTYPGPNKYENAIRDFYVLHDGVVGHLVEHIGDEYSLMIVSDHGHGQRPPRVLNINRVLKELGFLHTRQGRKMLGPSIMKKLRDSSAKVVGRFNLGSMASKMLRWIPFLKKAIVTATGIDWSNTQAYSIDMSGIKAYNYGGINVRDGAPNFGKSKDEAIKHIMTALIGIHHPDRDDRPLVRWILRRDELYKGPFLSLYPDIVLELESGFGLGSDPFGPVIGQALVHSVYPGSHTRDNGFFLHVDPQSELAKTGPESVIDIAPAILASLEISIPESMDRESAWSTDAARSGSI